MSNLTNLLAQALEHVEVPRIEKDEPLEAVTFHDGDVVGVQMVRATSVTTLYEEWAEALLGYMLSKGALIVLERKE